MAYKDADELSTLNVYNVGLEVNLTSRSPSVQTAPSSKSRPVSAKTDPKTRRLTQGKRIRPTSSHRLAKNRQELDHCAPTITTCQPYYDDWPPQEQHDRNFQESSPQSHQRYSSPMEDEQLVSQPHNVHFHYHEGELKVPCSTPLAADDDEYNFINQSEDRLHSSQSGLQRTSLNLSLPDVDDCVNDDEEEIDTLRLLDDLNINLSEGTASVTITPQLKARLAATSAANTSSSIESSPHPDQDTGEDNFLTEVADQKKFDMERDLQALLHQRRDTTISELVRQSKDCWVDEQTPIDNEGEDSLGSSSTTKDEALLGGLPEIADDNHGAQSKLSENIPSKVTDSIDIDRARNETIASHEETTSTKARTQSSPVDNLLYRWNIEVKDTLQVEVPLVDRKKNYEEIDDEINRRVQQIEQELANEIIESQLAIDQLEAEANNTEFRIPEFCEIKNEVEQQEVDRNEKRLGSKAFKLQRADVNVQQQAKKLGLKNRDVSQVFRAVTPRHKKNYVSSGQGKVKITNVTSRVNSGLRKKNSPSEVKTTLQQTSSSQSAELSISGNQNLKMEPQKDHLESKMAVKQRSVTFSDAVERKPVKKTVKTFAFGQDGSVQADTDVTQSEGRKPANRKYKIPDEVGLHLRKCVKKPPTPQSTNRLFSKLQPANQQLPSQRSASQLTNHKPDQRVKSTNERGRPQRIKSDPAHRKLSRERSAERKLLNGFNSQNGEEEANKVSSANRMHFVARNQQEVGICPPDEVPTAVELVSEIGGKEDSLGVNEQQQGGLSGVGTSTRDRPLSAHPQLKSQAKLTSSTRRAQSAPMKRRVVPHTSLTNVITTGNYIQREDPDEIDSITQVHDKVTLLGVDLDKSTLDRALLPPAKQSVNSCQLEMSKHFYTSGLLSSPEKWLKEEYKKMKKSKQEILRFQKAKGKNC